MKKTTLGLLCMILAASTMAGCSGGASGSGGVSSSDASQGGSTPTQASSGADSVQAFNEDGTFPISKEPVKLSILMVQDPNVIDYNENKLTKLYEEKVNVDLEFVLFPDIDAKQKISVMINAGDALPDIINVGLTDAETEKYGTLGIFVPLNQYYENPSSSYYISKWGDDYQSALPYITCADGNIYTVPVIDLARGNELSRKCWLSGVWLEKLGLSIPTTTEELYETLKAFRDGDPNGNGKKDEVPLIGCTNINSQPQQYLMNAFLYCEPTADYLLVKDGKISVAYAQSQWKDGLEYIHKLCAEELLSPLSFTQDEQQHVSTITAGEEQIFGGFTHNRPRYPIADMRKTDFVPIPPLKGPDGAQNATLTNSSIPRGKYYITKYCKNPEAAFRLADYMQSEEALLYHRYGEEGVDWKRSNLQAIYEGAKNVIDPILPWGQPQNAHWAAGNPLIWSDAFVSEAWDGTVDPSKANYQHVTIAAANKLYSDLVPDEIVRKIVYSPEETEQILDIYTTLKSYVDEQTVAFATGIKKLSEWDSYLKELENIGLKQYLEVTQAAYDRMMK